MSAQVFGDGRPYAHGHAILLTDGKNECEHPHVQDALAACADRFQCDCRGIGTNWVVSELRSIATALLWTVDIVDDPRDLAADFRALMESAMARASAPSGSTCGPRWGRRSGS